MPLYEFLCSSCGREQTLLMKFSDPHPVCACKEGDPPVMKKQMSHNTFLLKGSGWAKDGYSGKK